MPISEHILNRIRNNDSTLTELNLSSQYPSLKGEDMAPLADALKSNTYLQLLILGENEIGDKGVVLLASGLSHSGVLRTVDVPINNISNAGAIALLNAPIKSLDLAGNRVSDTGLQQLGKNCSLHSLIIHDNELTSSCVPYFLETEYLIEVVLDNNKLTPADVQRIQTHISENINKCIHRLATEMAEVVSKVAPSQRLLIKSTVDTILKEKLDTASLQSTFFTPPQTQ